VLDYKLRDFLVNIEGTEYIPRDYEFVNGRSWIFGMVVGRADTQYFSKYKTHFK
jgi:hypothetical protein